MHIPVLLKEVLTAFESLSIDVFFDGTLGAGGHAEAILMAHPEIKLYIGADQDETALALARERLSPWEDKLLLCHQNFSKIPEELKKKGIKPNAILLDIGVSSMQFDQGERGFSFRVDAPLDMRMDLTQEKTAADIVNHATQRELELIFRDLGEEQKWRRAAEAVVKGRPIATTFQLKEVLEKVLGKKRFGEKEPVTQIFQALRIATNRELEVLEEFLPQGIELLTPGGRMGIITFHSLEDRIVKDSFTLAASDKWNTSGYRGHFQDKTPEVLLISRKAIKPTDEETDLNPRARSAKLRVIEKI
jgi:16S rRNA (cytosine1402-N4)-methyltransferase